MARNPSYLGSYAHSSPTGNSALGRANWGANGGFSGRVTAADPSDPVDRGYDPSMAHEPATAAEEEYLESLFWLYEAGLPMTGANLARAMQLSAPTGHEMLARLERD